MAAKEGSMKSHRDIVRNLNRLAQHELDAIEAYSAAIERVQSARHRHKLSEIRADHQRHVQAVGVQVTRLGGPRLHHPSLFRMILRTQVALVSKAGGDAALLLTLRLWKGLTILRYRVALKWSGFPPEIVRVLSGNLEDELRHHSWLSEQTV